VKFTPSKPSLSVGEELRCTALGNPPPQITLGPQTLVKKAEMRSGDGWRSLVVSSDWVGSTFTVECSATNVVDGDESSVSSSVTFNVTGEQFSPVYCLIASANEVMFYLAFVRLFVFFVRLCLSVNNFT